MDNKTLADALIQILAPALPYLVGRGKENLPSEEAAPRDSARAKALWHRLRQKVEERPGALEAAQDLARAPEDADARVALRVQLRKLLEGDIVLAAEMASLVNSDGTIYGAGAAARGSGAMATVARGVAVGGGGMAIGRFGEGELSFGTVRAKSRD